MLPRAERRSAPSPTRGTNPRPPHPMATAAGSAHRSVAVRAQGMRRTGRALWAAAISRRPGPGDRLARRPDPCCGPLIEVPTQLRCITRRLVRAMTTHGLSRCSRKMMPRRARNSDSVIPPSSFKEANSPIKFHAIS